MPNLVYIHHLESLTHPLQSYDSKSVKMFDAIRYILDKFRFEALLQLRYVGQSPSYVRSLIHTTP